MPLPPLHVCHYCGREVSAKSTSILRLITAWVAGPVGKTVKEEVQDHYKYAHEWCLPKKPSDQTLSMF